VSNRVELVIDKEQQLGLDTPGYYSGFQQKADNVRDDFIEFLEQTKRQGRTVAAYGAAAKGNTLLNYSGISSKFIPYVVDRNQAKRGKYLPGSKIPIVADSRIADDRPDYVVIFPWNLRDEVIDQLAYIRNWGGRFVTAVPTLEIQ